MRKKQWMLLSAGLLALVLVACSSDDEIKTCAVDADCGSAELCHPNVKICVKTCNSGTDCPDSAKTCNAISTADDRKICRCISDALCGKDLVCNEAFKVCVPKDKEGEIEPPDVVGAACDSSKPQPDVCKYGLVCGSDDKCQELPSSSACSDRFPSNLGWDPANPTGPIVHSIRYVRSDYNKWCNTTSDMWRVQFEVKAYSTDRQLQKFNNTPLMLYPPAGSPTELWVFGNPGKPANGAAITDTGWVNEGDNHATITFSLCLNSDSYNNGGLAFNNGNTICVNR